MMLLMFFIKFIYDMLWEEFIVIKKFGFFNDFVKEIIWKVCF